MKQDRIFDGLSQRFQQKIYQDHDPRGAIRLHIVQDDLEQTPLWHAPLATLDAGGGMGQMTQWLARQGHHVDLCEPSAEMLAICREQLHTLAPDTTNRINLHQQTIQTFCSNRPEQYDLIVCHAVLEWLATPRETLSGLLNSLKHGGWLSLLFFNRNSKIFRHIQGGDLKPVLDNNIASDGHNGLAPISPLLAETVIGWLEEYGLTLHGWSGVRCFYDYAHPEVRKRMNLNDLLTLERRYSREEPWRSLGRYQHLICRKN